MGTRSASCGSGGDPAAMVDLMVVSSVHGWRGGSRRPTTFLRILSEFLRSLRETYEKKRSESERVMYRSSKSGLR